MNIITRGLLYLKGKKTRALLMLLVITLMSTSVIAAFTMKKTGELTQKTVHKTFQSVMVTPKANTLPEDAYGEGSLRRSDVDKLRKSDEVEGINASQSAFTQVEGKEVVKTKNGKGVDEAYDGESPYLNIQSNTNTKYDARFISGMLKLEQGRHIRETSNHEVLIHQDYAKLNHLKVGDTILFNKDPKHYRGSNHSKERAKIVGIFSGSTVAQATYPEEMVENTFLGDEKLVNDIYGYKKKDVKYYQTNFYLKPKADIEAFVSKLKKTNIDFNYFDILKKDPSMDTYHRSLKILNNTISTLFIGILIVASIMLVLSILFWINSKTRDTGILMALGKSKGNIIGGYLVEILVVVILALGISFCIGNTAGNVLGNTLINSASHQAQKEVARSGNGMQLGADSGTDMVMQTVKNVNVHLLPKEYLKFYGIILGLITASTAMATVSVLRQRPKDVLSKLS